MSGLPHTLNRFGAIAVVLLAAACTMPGRQTVNTPPSPPPRATAEASVYQVGFAPGSYAIDPAGHRTIEDVSSVVDGNEKAIVTIVGRTDATGDAQQNMHLSA